MSPACDPPSSCSWTTYTGSWLSPRDARVRAACDPASLHTGLRRPRDRVFSQEEEEVHPGVRCGLLYPCLMSSYILRRSFPAEYVVAGSSAGTGSHACRHPHTVGRASRVNASECELRATLCHATRRYTGL